MTASSPSSTCSSRTTPGRPMRSASTTTVYIYPAVDKTGAFVYDGNDTNVYESCGYAIYYTDACAGNVRGRDRDHAGRLRSRRRSKVIHAAICPPQTRQPQGMAFITPATPAWRTICGCFVAGVIIAAPKRGRKGMKTIPEKPPAALAGSGRGLRLFTSSEGG